MRALRWRKERLTKVHCPYSKHLRHHNDSSDIWSFCTPGVYFTIFVAFEGKAATAKIIFILSYFIYKDKSCVKRVVLI